MFKKKTLPKILICLAVVLLCLTALYFASEKIDAEANNLSSPYVELNNNIKVNTEDYYDGTKIMKLPSEVKDDDTISVIINTEAICLYEAYKNADTKLSFSDYIASSDAKTVKAEIANENEAIKKLIAASGKSYTVGQKYDTILSGFEILIKASDFEDVAKAIDGKATAIVGEVYNKAETELVENKVNVYETGIFDSSKFAQMGYDGTGMVVAVLDTGLDYTHTAFSIANFGVKDESKLGLRYQDIVNLLANKDFYAEQMQSGLTANDVFINNKVPFGFDYADGDSEVFPINSDHGTHVAGIIAGKDETITGVAPNAQLVIMKTFSDIESTARTSWILSALEDCVSLGVDVINMSLGTDCGFSRPSDKENVNNIYERIKDAGISLVVAASNSYNSTYGSEKNGNLGLTSNPDSATVGSPSTYDAAISIASISGVKTPYLLFGDRIIYFTESADRVSEEKVFLDDVLKDGETEAEIEFVVIPGVGRSADYSGIDVTGKIALVRRGSSTFEEKADVAEQKGAIGIIVYNNVSGDIKMNVGDAQLGACSISQEDGEILAAAKSGTIKVARTQVSGPFMSDFSSWGPTPSLGIKPELTAHGGSILSAVPGQDYDRISGTSMATPNMSGVSALMRQYVTEELSHLVKTDGEIDNKKVTALVNCLLMSTADIINNKNGLPYSVRKQGAGLANLLSAYETDAYIITYDENGDAMDKTKLELGDDPEKTGVYELNFSIMNFGNNTLVYDLDYYVMTEGVSDTKTSHGETTVTETAYILNGAKVTINKVENGELKDGKITVNAGKTADVKLTIELSDSDKKYLDDSFANGMYVEGFISLKAVSGTSIDLGFPYLAFYGDWSQAPIFDLDYYATNKDELDDGIDIEDKTLPDAYATRPIGSIEGDYVNFLGSFYFEQDPSEKAIAADRKYISLSNQTGAVNSLEYVWAGLLRNCQRVEVTIVEDATGEVVFETVDYDIRKSYSNGQTIYPANIDIGFNAMEQNLKNNTKYTVTLKSYLDYENDGSETNENNTFTFPVVTDFEAPIVEGVEFYTEYDKSSKETRLFAKIAVYDNHYAMGMQVGYVGDDGEGGLILNAFDQYIKGIYSDFNSTSYVVYELTDHIQAIKNNAYNKNTFTVACYDYALNLATYEIGLPDEYTDFYFDLGTDADGNAITTVTLSPNQTYDLNPTVYPNTEWGELLSFRSYNTNVARIVNNKVIAIAPGSSRIFASFYDEETKTTKTASFTLKVLGEGDEGYKVYSKPVVDNFYLTGYLVEKAYYFMNSADRELGVTGDEMKFTNQSSYSLSMYPSEAVTIRYILDAYFPNNTDIVFSSSDDKIVSVDENGKIVANSEGYASVSVSVLLDGKSTYYSKSISIEVKDPYSTSGPMLANYYGNGGLVIIPESLSVTQIGQFAFSNYKYIPKQTWEIDPESNETYKMWFVGDDTITSIVIPEGVETIGAFAFANLTALEEITLPSTLKMIDQGAFYGCSKLSRINGIENVKFINQNAFYGCSLSGEIKLDNAVAIGNYAFGTGSVQYYYEDEETGEAYWTTKEAGKNQFTSVILSEKTQSIGAYAFYGSKSLESVTFKADKVQLGMCVFADCSALKSIEVNAQVIPTGAFDGCSSLESVTLGKDVMQIGEYAFRGAKITAFTVDKNNTTFYPVDNKPYILNKDGNELLYVASGVKGELTINDSKITSVATGAFSGNAGLTKVSIPSVTSVGNYAFAGCSELEAIELGKLTYIGDYAFHNTSITRTHSFESVKEIGAYAYAETKVTSVTIPDGVTVKEGAFRDCKSLNTVKIGNNVTLGTDAFRFNNMLAGNYTSDYYEIEENGKTKEIYYYVYLSPLASLEIGNNVILGDSAFYGCAQIEKITLGKGAVIGDYAFYNASKLSSITNLENAISIGSYAFSGDVLYEFTDEYLTVVRQKEDGSYCYAYYASLLTEINLSSLTELGAEAFAHCQTLEKVTLGAALKEIPQRAFANCAVLKDINFENIETIGNEAFAETAIKKAELNSIKEIGSYAFVYVDELERIILNENGCKVLEGAFSYCPNVSEVENLDKVTYIDKYAFTYTALTDIDVSNATYIGDHAFMKEEVTKITLTLGNKLSGIGENPFAMCAVDEITSTVTEEFNGKEYTKVINTFDLSDAVKIIDGSIYKVVKNGLVLVTFAGQSDSITVADDTVRISALAFAGSDVEKVVLPYTVISIGHKAFYACNSLTLVSFSSYNAPILEEEYDYSYYASMENLPASGDYDFTDVYGNPIVLPGLGITEYFMYNVTGDPTNIYYGANFVDYIGHIDNKIVMIRPSNGQNYGSFIFGQYFNVVIDGDIAADDVTLNAITAINKLPEKVALTDKALVEAARAAYNLIANNEQKSLVDKNGLYAKLTAAEKRISNLEYLENEDNQTNEPITPDVPSTPSEEKEKLPVGAIVAIVILSVVAALGTVGSVILGMPYIKKLIALIVKKG